MDVAEKQRLTEEQIEQLAIEIREFLFDNWMWQDVDIFFNHRKFGCKGVDGCYYYNDRERLFEEKGVEPCCDFMNADHILSMAYDGPVYEMLHRGMYREIRRKFDEIFEKRGLYYEFGDSGNLSCYYI